MKDVALRAGVSQTTVSFVFNNVADENSIPQETQDRVWEVVRELGYRPNSVARNLRSQRTHTIGFISDDIATTPFAGQMIQGAQDLAWGNNKLILLVNTGRDKRMKFDAVEALLERQVDGIIYATMYHRQVEPPAAIYETPTVLLDCFVSDRSLPSVVPDEITGGKLATETLIHRGHRRIGFIQNEDPIPAAFGRLQGYREALTANGLTFDESLVAAGTSDQHGGYFAAQALLGRSERPTAIFCFNDRMAMGAYQAAGELGIAIPRDLAVVGFDNQETISPWLRPALTTMQLPHYEMGQWAAAFLIDMIAHPERDAGEPQQHKIACPLVERMSA
jgi:LacI family transcriptional regulator